MNTENVAPKRIARLFAEPNPGGQIRLLNREEVTFVQGENRIVGFLEVSKQWPSMLLHWSFTGKDCGADLNVVTFGDCEIERKKFDFTGQVISKSSNLISGFVNGNLEAGSEHKLTKITAHFANFPDLRPGSEFFIETVLDGKHAEERMSQAIIEAQGWTITLQSDPKPYSFSSDKTEWVLNGITEICRTDKTEFHVREGKEIIERLRLFLSFGFGTWTPPILVVGSNAVAKKSWQYFSNTEVSSAIGLRGWLASSRTDELSPAFDGFLTLIGKDEWREVLELSIVWLIEASRNAGGIDGSIALSQIPLEMISWMYFVDGDSIIDGGEFEKLGAPSKLQLLLSKCEIPSSVPEPLCSLVKLGKGNGLGTGPKVVVRIRNSIIHPHRKNRLAFAALMKEQSVDETQVRRETGRLFRWYLTLVLLRSIGFMGTYCNRWTAEKSSVNETVPWANSDKEGSGDVRST